MAIFNPYPDPDELLLSGFAPTDIDAQLSLGRAVRGVMPPPRQPPIASPPQAPAMPDMGMPPVPPQAGGGLPLTRQKIAVSTKGVEPSDEAAEYRKKGAEQLVKEAQLYGQMPDMSEQVAAAKERQEGAQRDFLAGLALAKLGGEGLAPIGGQMLKQAMAARGPYEVPGGYGTIEGGKFVANPLKMREMEAVRAEKMAAAYENMAKNVDTAHEKAQATQMAADWHAAAVAARQGQQQGHVTSVGLGTGGERVYQYNSGPNAGRQFYRDAQGEEKPYAGGAALSQAAADKHITAVQEANLGIQRAQGLIQQMKENPGAFGNLPALAAILPGGIGSRAMIAALTPEQLQVRQQVLRQSAEIVHQLYGAALTKGEEARAREFQPTNTDNDAKVMANLVAALNWANQQAQTFGPMVREQAEIRSGMAPGASQPSPDLVPPQGGAPAGRKVVRYVEPK